MRQVHPEPVSHTNSAQPTPTDATTAAGVAAAATAPSAAASSNNGAVTSSSSALPPPSSLLNVPVVAAASSLSVSPASGTHISIDNHDIATAITPISNHDDTSTERLIATTPSTIVRGTSPLPLTVTTPSQVPFHINVAAPPSVPASTTRPPSEIAMVEMKERITVPLKGRLSASSSRDHAEVIQTSLPPPASLAAATNATTISVGDHSATNNTSTPTGNTAATNGTTSGLTEKPPLTASSSSGHPPFQRQRGAKWRRVLSADPNSLYEHDHDHSKWMLMPTSPLRQFWDFLVASFVIWMSWKVPFVVAFPTSEFNSTSAHGFDTFLEVFFWCDIVINFRTAYIHSGHIETNSKRVTMHYLKGWFPVDIVASFPFEALVSLAGGSSATAYTTRKAVKISKLLKLAYLLRVGRIVRYMRQYFKFRHVLAWWLAILATTHWVACLNFIIDSDFDSTTWNLIDTGEDVWPYYLAYLDNAVLHLLTIQESVKTSPLQHGFSMLVTLIAALGYALLIAACVVLVSSFGNAHEKFRAKMANIEDEMDQLLLPDDVRVRVRRYYDYLWINKKGQLFGGSSLYNDPDLSATLRKDVSLALVHGVFPLRKIKVLERCSEECLASIVLLLRTHVFMPGDWVCRVGEVGKELYYCSKGQVEIITREDDPNPPKLTVGAFFGEVALLTNSRRTASIRAFSCCELQVLTKEDLMMVFRDYPEYEAIMHEMALKRLMDEKKNGNSGPDKQSVLTTKLKASHARARAQLDGIRTHGVAGTPRAAPLERRGSTFGFGTPLGVTRTGTLPTPLDLADASPRHRLPRTPDATTSTGGVANAPVTPTGIAAGGTDLRRRRTMSSMMVVQEHLTAARARAAARGTLDRNASFSPPGLHPTVPPTSTSGVITATSTGTAPVSGHSDLKTETLSVNIDQPDVTTPVTSTSSLHFPRLGINHARRSMNAAHFHQMNHGATNHDDHHTQPHGTATPRGSSMRATTQSGFFFPQHPHHTASAHQHDAPPITIDVDSHHGHGAAAAAPTTPVPPIANDISVMSVTSMPSTPLLIGAVGSRSPAVTSKRLAPITPTHVHHPTIRRESYRTARRTDESFDGVGESKQLTSIPASPSTAAAPSDQFGGNDPSNTHTAAAALPTTAAFRFPAEHRDDPLLSSSSGSGGAGAVVSNGSNDHKLLPPTPSATPGHTLGIAETEESDGDQEGDDEEDPMTQMSAHMGRLETKIDEVLRELWNIKAARR